MREVATGVWHWEAVHPDWTEEAGGWGPEVSSYALDDYTVVRHVMVKHG